MARTREFEPKEALDAAMRVFWKKGYTETSYDDLVGGTGVSRKGLYTVFGGKRALFLKALENYRRTVVPHLLNALSDKNVTIEDIRGLFHDLGKLATTEPGRQGCFMARTSADDTMSDPDVNEIVNAHLDDLHDRLYFSLRSAGFTEERANRLAPYLLGVMQGLFALAHAGTGPEIVEPFVEEAMQALG